MINQSPGLLQNLKNKTRHLRREVLVMYLALRHPLTPWYAKLLAGCVVIYALSPIDLIPDPIPILGYLDDIILVPLGVLAVRWMIPASVLSDCRRQASEGVEVMRAWKWIGGGVVVGLWLVCIIWIARLFLR